MNVTIEQVIGLAEIEYKAAVAAHGPLASMHEGWSVALEEIQETEEALGAAKAHMAEAWSAIRKDDAGSAERGMDLAFECALQVACEALQVAAVCKRFLDLTRSIG